MSSEPPAATAELTADDVRIALSKSFADRHGELDIYAEVYQHAVALYAALPDADKEMQESGFENGFREFVDVSDIYHQLKQLVTGIEAHVLEQHEHALRWTLDPYDEMDA